jgi:hypothetical protein
MTRRTSALAGLLRRTPRSAWTRALAILMAGLLALVPVAQAYCDLELLAPSERIGVATASDQAPADGPFPDPCFEDLPSAISVGGKFYSPAAGASHVPDQPLVALPNAILSPPSPRFARTRLRLAPPPPELPFRRSMRLLI